MTKVYIIRHAEAEGNLYRRSQGQYDSQVTPRGHSQIAALERRFAGAEIDAVYSSDLTRTRETAAAIYRLRGLPLHLDRRLREVKMGVWEDVSWGDIEWSAPGELIKFNTDPINWHIEGSEDFFDLRRRLTAAIDLIAAQNEGRTVAVVSHGCAIRAYLSGIANGDSGGVDGVPHGDNTNVSLVEYDNGGKRIVFFGDSSHLNNEDSTFAHQRWWREKTTLDSSNLRFAKFSPEADAALYAGYRREAYSAVHGTLEGSEKSVSHALRLAEERPELVSLVYARERPAGCLVLDTDRDSGEGAGCIKFYYLTPELRGAGMGVQLLGEATSVYRALGRQFLRIFLTRDNERAREFFEKNLFTVTGERDGALQMDRSIELQKHEGEYGGDF